MTEELDFMAIGASLAMSQNGFTDDEIVSIFGCVPHAGVTTEMLDQAEAEMMKEPMIVGGTERRRRT